MAWNINMGLLSAGQIANPSTGSLGVTGSVGQIIRGSQFAPSAGGVLMPGAQSILGSQMAPLAGGILIAGGGGTLSAPTDVVMINQGGPGNDVNSNPSASNGTYLAIQWSSVAGGSGYKIRRYNAFTGASTVVATNAQPLTFQGSIASGVLTVATDNTGGLIIPGVRLSAPGLLQETQILSAPSKGGTTGTGGTGTYNVNRSQTLGSVLFTANYFIDTGATNAVHAATDLPGTPYYYTVATMNGGIEGPESTVFTSWMYRNGLGNWFAGNDGLSANSELSFGPPSSNAIWASANGNPQGGPYVLEYTVDGGFQPAVGNPQCPQWQAEWGAFKYLVFDFNPGSSYTGWALNVGVVSHVPTGDVFGLMPAVNAFAGPGTYGPAPVANTWGTYKIPLSLLGDNMNSFVGSISNGSGGAGSTCSVTSCGSGLFGSTGGFDNSGYIYGTGIPSPAWVQANVSGGSGPGGSGPGSKWTIYGTGNTPISVNVSSDGTWVWQRTQRYKFSVFDSGGPSQQVYLNNVGVSRT